MQKSLTQMNLQLTNVISDIMGVTGQKILRAILAGERNANKLAEMRNERIQASREEIAASLTGNWRPELLFALKQEIDRYDFCQRQIAECDQKINQHLGTLPARASLRRKVPARTSIAVPTGVCARRIFSTPPPPSRGAQKQRGLRFAQFAPHFMPRKKRAVRCKRSRRSNNLRMSFWREHWS